MFSHLARELGVHPCIGSRAATAVDGEVPISSETICRSIETEGA
jgi:hypothetical protein